MSFDRVAVAILIVGLGAGACGSATLKTSMDGSANDRTSTGTGGAAGAVGGKGGAAGGPGGAVGGASGMAGNAGGAGRGSAGAGAAGSAGTAGGLGAGGSVAGAGGSILAGLGTSCSSGTICASGNCADGVCCDAPCDRVCEQCSATGACQLTADDPGCGNIACPSDTICSDYETSLTTSRCASRGLCKTASNCSFVPAAAGTFCSGTTAPLFCDGAGNCNQPPTVSCGGDSACPVSPGQCCYDVSGSTPATTCQSAGATCMSSTSTDCYAIHVTCGGPKDCPTGQVCCYACGLAFSFGTVSCTTLANCDPSTGLSFHLQVCKTNADCPSGQTCQPQTVSTEPLPAGYKICSS